MKETSRSLLFSWVTIDGCKNFDFYKKKKKKSYAPLMEFTTHLVKMKDFYNQIKILYSLWGVQPNIEKKKIQSQL